MAATQTPATSAAVMPIKDYILLAACGANQLLPMNPELPAGIHMNIIIHIYITSFKTYLLHV
jgi:hypothetical protein